MPAIFVRLNPETGEVECRTPAEMHDAVFGLDAAEEQLRKLGFEKSHDEL